MNEKSVYQLKAINKSFRVIVLAVILSVLLILDFQSQTITFQKTILAPDIEYFTSVVQTPDEGYIAVGRKRESGIRDDMYIVRYNKFGDTLWSKTIDRESAVSIIKTNDNNYAAIGVHGSFVKFDINGNILILGNYYNDDLTINKILQTPDNSFFICGRFFPNTTFPFLAKFNSNGVLTWDSVYSVNIESGVTTDMVFASDNFLVLSGYHQLQTNQPNYLFLAKINLNGNIIWSNTSFTHPNAYTRSLTQTNNGEFIACGAAYLFKFSSIGTLLWRKIQDSVLSVGYESITITRDGNYIYAGWLDSADYQYVRIRKTDTSGNEIWRKLHGFTDRNHTGWEIKETNDSGFVIVGRTDFQEEDPYILKVDKKGDLLPPINVNVISEVIPKTFVLSQNYPNPFNPKTIIHFKIPEISKITIRVFDIQGRLIQLLLDKELKPASYSISIELNDYSTGVYLYTLEAQKNKKIIFRDSKKLLLLK